MHYECHFRSLLGSWSLYLELSICCRWPGGTRTIWLLSATAVREDSGWPLESTTAGSTTSQTPHTKNTSLQCSFCYYFFLALVPCTCTFFLGSGALVLTHFLLDVSGKPCFFSLKFLWSSSKQKCFMTPNSLQQHL